MTVGPSVPTSQVDAFAARLDRYDQRLGDLERSALPDDIAVSGDLAVGGTLTVGGLPVPPGPESSGTYTPALTASGTNPNLGAGGAAVGKWWRDGEFVVVEFGFSFNGAGVAAGSGTYLVSLPFSLSSAHAAYCSFGGGNIYDASASSNPSCTFSRNASTSLLRIHAANIVSAAVPWTWAAGDSITGTVRYRPA